MLHMQLPAHRESRRSIAGAATCQSKTRSIFLKYEALSRPANSRDSGSVFIGQPRPNRHGVNMKEVEFLFDYGSPFSYLASLQIEGFAKRNNATIAYTPILLGAVLKATA